PIFSSTVSARLDNAPFGVFHTDGRGWQSFWLGDGRQLGDARSGGMHADYLLGVSASSVSPKSARSFPATIAC
ncbi:MAG: hypothetical protein AABY89_07020, partial [Acidobacteriota bacterium]